MHKEQKNTHFHQYQELRLGCAATGLLSDDDDNMTMPINAGDMPTGMEDLQNDGGDEVKMKMKTVIMNPVPVEITKTPTTRMTTTPIPIRLMVWTPTAATKSH